MQLQQFEQEILRLAFETETRITTASVAYYLGIPSRQANEMLNSLLKEGVLELESDLDGNLFYSIPNQPEEVKAITELKKSEARVAANAISSHVFRAHGPERPSAPIKSPVVAAATLDGGAVRRSPIAPPEQGMVRIPQPPVRLEQVIPESKGKWAGFDEYYPENAGQNEGAMGRLQTPRAPIAAWTGAITRGASTDGSIGHQTQGGPLLLSSSARCDPSYLPNNQPVMAGCMENVAGLVEYDNSHVSSDDIWFGNRDEGALVPASETALSRDYFIEQPEHQPGMALLLSLILCGTGQIYNGESSKGIMMMVLCFLLWFVLLGWVVHIWSIVDAVVVAEKLHRTGEDPT